MPGPPPKRSEERRRRNKPAVETTKVDLDKLVAEPVEIPVANPDWDPVAKQWYESLPKSGQSLFYEPGDWAMAYLLAEQIDRALAPQPMVVGSGEDSHVEFHTVPMPGATLNALLKGMTALLVAEGDRRRAQIELERKKARDAALAGDGKVVPISQTRMDRFKTKEA